MVELDNGGGFGGGCAAAGGGECGQGREEGRGGECGWDGGVLGGAEMGVVDVDVAWLVLGGVGRGEAGGERERDVPVRIMPQPPVDQFL